MKETMNMKMFLSRLVDVAYNDCEYYHEHNFEIERDEGACGPDSPESYYYFWNSENPLTIIAAMRAFIANKHAFMSFENDMMLAQCDQ